MADRSSRCGRDVRQAGGIRLVYGTPFARAQELKRARPRRYKARRPVPRGTWEGKAMLSCAARTHWWRGWASVAIILAIPAGAPLGLIGDAAAAEVTGKVFDQDGNPVPNATVRLDPVPGELDVIPAASGSDRYVTTRSRESGRYVRETVTPGKYRLTCGGFSSREIYVGIGTLRENCRQ